MSPPPGTFGGNLLYRGQRDLLDEATIPGHVTEVPEGIPGPGCLFFQSCHGISDRQSSVNLSTVTGACLYMCVLGGVGVCVG